MKTAPAHPKTKSQYSGFRLNPSQWYQKMAETFSDDFRPIPRDFLDKDWKEGFGLFYKAGDGSGTKFLKFLDYSPSDYSHLYKIMKEKDHHEFFVHEEELYNYYRHCLVKNLKMSIIQESPPTLEVFQRVYPIAIRIINDYLEFQTSEKILTTLDEIPDLLMEAQAREPVHFPEIFSITRRDKRVANHCVNVGYYCLSLGMELKMNPEELRELLIGGMYADIGKKFIPAEILLKENKLNSEETRVVRKHASFGRKLLKDMRGFSDIVLNMARDHHENFDGSGYPHQLKGKRISYHGRICKIMDVFNALTSERPFRKQMAPYQALTLMKNDLPNHFDPELLTTFFNAITLK